MEPSYLVEIYTFWKLVFVFFAHNILVAIVSSEWEVNWRNRTLRGPRENYFEIIDDYQYSLEADVRSCCTKKVFLKTSENSQEKNLCRSLSFNKVAGLWLVILSKKSLGHGCFPANFAKFLRTLFLMNTSGGCF